MGTAAVDTSRKLGVVAGGGALPSLVINEARKQGREVFVLALEHFVDLDLIPDMIRPQASSRDEIHALIADLGLTVEAREAVGGSTRRNARVLKRTRQDFRAALNAVL